MLAGIIVSGDLFRKFTGKKEKAGGRFINKLGLFIKTESRKIGCWVNTGALYKRIASNIAGRTDIPYFASVLNIRFPWNCR
jgi:hypothetical protein